MASADLVALAACPECGAAKNSEGLSGLTDRWVVCPHLGRLKSPEYAGHTFVISEPSFHLTKLEKAQKHESKKNK